MRAPTIHGPGIRRGEPAPPKRPDEGGGSRWAWLVTAADVYEAELVRGYLESSGVPVALHGRDDSPFAWMYPAGNMNVPVQVFVPQTLLDVAKLHLLESSLMQPPAPTPEPAATRVRPHRRLWLIVGIASAVAVLIVVIVELLGLGPCRTAPRDGRALRLCAVR